MLYVGVTNCLERRLFEHRNYLVPGFTSKYKVHKLVYYDRHESIEDAIYLEKQLKGKTRKKKDALINARNPDWHDLSI